MPGLVKLPDGALLILASWASVLICYINILAFFTLILPILMQKSIGSFMSIEDDDNTWLGVNNNSSKPFCSTYCRPETVGSSFHVLTHFLPTATPWAPFCYHPYLTNGKPHHGEIRWLAQSLTATKWWVQKQTLSFCFSYGTEQASVRATVSDIHGNHNSDLSSLPPSNRRGRPQYKYRDMRKALGQLLISEHLMSKEWRKWVCIHAVKH